MTPVTLEPVPWDEAASGHLITAFDDQDAFAHTRHDVLTGAETLYAICTVEGERIGSLVARLEDVGGARRELVVVAMGGRARGAVSLHHQVVGPLDSLALALRACMIRAHAGTAPLGRMIRAAGFEPTEWVFRRAVPDG